MSETNINLAKNAMNYGGITGVFLFLIYLLSAIVSEPASFVVSLLNYLVIGIGIFIGTKKFRDQQMNGSISYRKAMHSGILISLFAGILIAFATYLYLNFVDSSMIEKTLQQTEANLLDAGKSDEEVEKTIDALSTIMTPGMMATAIVISYSFFGALISLITSAFIKNNGSGSSNTFNNFIQENS